MYGSQSRVGGTKPARAPAYPSYYKGYGPSEPALIGAILEVCPPRSQGLLRCAGTTGGIQFWEAVGRSEIPVYGIIHVPEHEWLGKSCFVAENGRRQYSEALEGTPRWMSTEALETLDATDVFPVKQLRKDTVELLHEVNVVYDVLAMKNHQYELLQNSGYETAFYQAPAVVCRTLTIICAAYLDHFGPEFCCKDSCRGTSDFEGLYFFAGNPTPHNIAATIIHHIEVVNEDSIAVVDPKSGNGSRTISQNVVAHRKQWNATMCVTPWLDEEDEAAKRAPCPKMTAVLDNFLKKCHYLQSPLDLAPLRYVQTIGKGFLYGCSGLRYLDLSPLENLVKFGTSFMKECSGLQDLDVTPLFKAIIATKSIPEGFLGECRGLRSIDFTGLVLESDGGSVPAPPTSSSSSAPAAAASSSSSSSASKATNTTNSAGTLEVDALFLAGCTGLETIRLGPIRKREPTHQIPRYRFAAASAWGRWAK